MRTLIVTALLAIGLAGCQTPEQMMADAGYVCRSSGLRPGTKAYNNCINSEYRAARQSSQATGNAVAAGAAAGLVGGAVIAASTPSVYYGSGYYYGPGYYPATGIYYGTGVYYGGYPGYYGRRYYGGPYIGRAW
jgi:hypothetical protein